MVSTQLQQMQAASDLPNLNFGLSVKNLQCLIHPVIVSNILDHFLRRPESQKTVVGTLLGTLDGQVVDIQTCFSVPIEIEEQSKNKQDIVID
jgi:translation initiation factor 3 subunit F